MIVHDDCLYVKVVQSRVRAASATRSRTYTSRVNFNDNNSNTITNINTTTNLTDSNDINMNTSTNTNSFTTPDTKLIINNALTNPEKTSQSRKLTDNVKYRRGNSEPRRSANYKKRDNSNDNQKQSKLFAVLMSVMRASKYVCWVLNKYYNHFNLYH